MERRQALKQVRDLRRRLAFLRPLRPGNPSYLLWIGDIAELANSVWGIGSPQSLSLAGALRRRAADATGIGPEDDYLERLRGIDEVLDGFEAELIGPG